MWKMPEKFDIKKHIFVPEHKKLNQKEAKEVLDKFGIHFGNLPKILITDPAISNLGVKQGDIIQIKRKSDTAGDTIFYRGVVNE